MDDTATCCCSLGSLERPRHQTIHYFAFLDKLIIAETYHSARPAGEASPSCPSLSSFAHFWALVNASHLLSGSPAPPLSLPAASEQLLRSAAHRCACLNSDGAPPLTLAMPVPYPPGLSFIHLPPTPDVPCTQAASTRRRGLLPAAALSSPSAADPAVEPQLEAHDLISAGFTSSHRCFAH